MAGLSVHAIGVIGLVVIFIIGTTRPINLGVLGQSIAALGSPLVVALLLCGVGAVTSAFASSAGILGAMIPLAAPLMATGAIGTTGLVTALCLSATLVYNGMLAWGASMVIIAPILTWLVFVL